MIHVDNRRRAQCAERAIAEHHRVKWSDYPAKLVPTLDNHQKLALLLRDLLHFADHNEENFLAAMDVARALYTEDLEEERQ